MSKPFLLSYIYYILYTFITFIHLYNHFWLRNIYDSKETHRNSFRTHIQQNKNMSILTYKEEINGISVTMHCPNIHSSKFKMEY